MAKEIALHGCAQAIVDGPYGGYSPLIKGECEVAVIFAGGIGVGSSSLPDRAHETEGFASSSSKDGEIICHHAAEFPSAHGS